MVRVPDPPGDAPHVVYVCRELPWPPNNGSRIRSARLLGGVARAFPTTLVALQDPDREDPAGDEAAFRAEIPVREIEVVPHPGTHKRVAQLRSLPSRRSYWLNHVATTAITERVEQVVAREGAALVQWDDAFTARAGPVAGPVNVFAPHNVEYRIIQATAASDTGLRKLFGEVEWRKMRGEEAELWRSVTLCLAVSEVDAAVMRRGGARRVEVVPNGTDAVEHLPLRRRAPGEPLRILFVGAGDYRPYERGVSWVGDEVLPLLRAQLPVHLDVVGHFPRQHLDAPDVTYHGRVPTMAPFYEQAHVAVVPVFEGSGTRLKILEALAYGRPVVSTRLGAEGLPVAPGEHYLRAEDAPAFADALLSVARELEGPADRVTGMLDRGLEVAKGFWWSSIADRLVELHRGLTAGRGAPPG